MITLTQAFRLMNVEDSEVVYLRNKGDRWTEATGYTVKQIREKLDMKAINVCHIGIHFSYSCSDCWEFEITMKPRAKKRRLQYDGD